MCLQGRIRWVHVRHEEAGAFAAGAAPTSPGRWRFCAGSCGPGNLHLINGLYDCHRNRVPVLAIAAQIPSPEIGSGYFQETHPEILFRECSHYCELVSSPAQMPRSLEMAIRAAVGQRGVAVVVISGDTALEGCAGRTRAEGGRPHARSVARPAGPSVPMKLRQRSVGSLPLRA